MKDESSTPANEPIDFYGIKTQINNMLAHVPGQRKAPRQTLRSFFDELFQRHPDEEHHPIIVEKIIDLRSTITESFNLLQRRKDSAAATELPLVMGKHFDEKIKDPLHSDKVMHRYLSSQQSRRDNSEHFQIIHGDLKIMQKVLGKIVKLFPVAA